MYHSKQIEQMVDGIIKFRHSILTKAPHMKERTDRHIRRTLDDSRDQKTITDEEYNYLLDRLGYTN